MGIVYDIVPAGITSEITTDIVVSGGGTPAAAGPSFTKGTTHKRDGLTRGASSGTHGLGGHPDMVMFYMQNTVTEQGWRVGDRAYFPDDEELVAYSTPSRSGIACNGDVRGPNRTVQGEQPLTTGRWETTNVSYKIDTSQTGTTLTKGTVAEKTGIGIGDAEANHGLGSAPDFLVCYIECTTADAGWVVGDRLYWIDDEELFAYANTTKVGLSLDANSFFHRKQAGTPVAFAPTSGSWKAVVIPYKVETGGAGNTITKGATIESVTINDTVMAINHGLGGQPDFVVCYAECKTAHLTYAVGDRIHWPDDEELNLWTSDTQIGISLDQTMAWPRKTSGLRGNASPRGNWKIVAIPYKIS